LAPSNVQILGWVDSAYFWSAVDIAVSTSRNEGMPISLIEAQMSGVPVIATDVGSTSEIIQNQDTGFLIKAIPSEFADGILKIFQDENKFQIMRNKSRIKSLELFGVQMNIELHQKVYLKNRNLY
jgi:glycosyltransferase involved in cell wall biosynthesis